MKKFTVAALIVGLFTLSGMSAWAFGSCPDRGWDKALNQEQKMQMKQAWGQFMTQTQNERTQLAGKMEQLKTLYAQPTPDREKIAALQNEIIELRAAIAKMAVNWQSSLSEDLYVPAGMMGMRLMGGFDKGRSRGGDADNQRGPHHDRGQRDRGPQSGAPNK